ncbi:HET-domain-containing protein [Annulohypoxylon maeteangense]|uniref:HET-domain-containing protein n=1 Tax=Annulohypoxylon maeteangense TaxID=1927788 RepID=UPI002008E1B6|nr:HET-domain-containing protein [Annulohypoxylon maeteangense]KAI0884286.1 HET-domain-containing protein [Annulohypoxylon maeteangense]
MRLLNVHTGLLEEFFDIETTPKYAILSHTWNKEEVTLQDLEGEGYKSKLGYKKIEGCCHQAIEDEYDYIWVDTCCIDKKSLTELSEAINSMYEWYSKSAICYVYLADVNVDAIGQVHSSLLERCRWFSRGWTLQELLAPRELVFFDQHWRAFGSVSRTSRDSDIPDIASLLPAITKIDGRVLRERHLIHRATAAERFSWAAHRKTTRKEDMAYCLLGLLGVNMPLLYGEGERAFTRLQQEYIRQYNDPTLLLWGFRIPCQNLFWRSTSEWALAPVVSLFSGFSSPPKFEKNNILSRFSCTNNGIEIELLLIDLGRNIQLACFGTSADFPIYHRKSFEQTLSSPLLSPLRRFRRGAVALPDRPVIALPLSYCPTDSVGDFTVYERALPWPPFLIPEGLCRNAKWTRVYIKGVDIRSVIESPLHKLSREYVVNISKLIWAGFNLDAVYPPGNVICSETHIIYKVQEEGVQRFIFVFNRDEDFSFALFAEYKFQNSKLVDVYFSLGGVTMMDILHYLLPRGKILSERARRKAFAKLGRSLQGVPDPKGPGITHFKIPVRKIRRFGTEYLITSVSTRKLGNLCFDFIEPRWEEYKHGSD